MPGLSAPVRRGRSAAPAGVLLLVRDLQVVVRAWALLFQGHRRRAGHGARGSGSRGAVAVAAGARRMQQGGHFLLGATAAVMCHAAHDAPRDHIQGHAHEHGRRLQPAEEEAWTAGEKK